MIRFLVLLLPVLVFAGVEEWKLFDEPKKFKKVQFLDAKVLKFDRIGKERFYGISALDYDRQTKTLYMLNDRSRLFRFRFEVKDDKIKTLKPINSCRLRKTNGKYFFLWQSDSEGISKRGDDFFVSFEGQYPRIKKFNKDCRQIGQAYLYKKLKNYRNYQSKNRALESLEYVRGYGLLTSPEKSLKNQKKGFRGIYNYKGQVCRVRVDDGLSVVDYESDGKGNLIALFRKLDVLHMGFVVSLKRIKLQRGECKVEELATLSSMGLDNIDNFEGITKVGKNLYIMISDDNDRFFEETLLVLFRVS